MADGFSMHAKMRIGQMARDHLERLCRYILRPALCNARLERLSDGRILARLKRTWADGTWAKMVESLDLLAKGSALIPLPGTNLLRQNGQFAPMGRWRSKIVATAGRRKTTPCPGQTEKQKQKKYSWAALLKRAFLIHVLKCTAYGGRRELIAVIKQSKTVHRILDHLGIPSTPATFKPARPPPEELWPEHTWE